MTSSHLLSPQPNADCRIFSTEGNVCVCNCIQKEPIHSGPGWGNFVTGPQIFVFKIEPGAHSYMPGDPFGPKKPSISPYWDFAVTWQTSSWLKNGDFSRKKWYLLYGP